MTTVPTLTNFTAAPDLADMSTLKARLSTTVTEMCDIFVPEMKNSVIPAINAVAGEINTKATEAAESAAAAATLYDQLDDRFLGVKTEDPATDNDGNPLLAGALYYNSTLNVHRTWTGTAWASVTQSITQDYFYNQPAGSLGALIACTPDELLPAGWVRLSGHFDKASPNFGALMDSVGSYFVRIAPFYYKMTGNTISVSNTYQTGYVQPYAFTFNPSGFFWPAHLAGRDGDQMVFRPMLAPLSTSSANNPISVLKGAPANTYAGWVDACKASGYRASLICEWTALQLLVLSQSQAMPSSAYCAWIDTAPYFPKGNNNNALKDANDTSVIFQSAGNATYPSCALTGSANNPAKTTHNGQLSGIRDLNGNMYKILIGLTFLAKTGATGTSGGTAIAMTAHGLSVGDVIYFGGTPASGSTYNTAAYTVAAVVDANNFTVTAGLERNILATDGVYSPRYFRILKPTVDPSTITSANLLDSSLYDLLDLTGIIAGNTGSTLFGNGTDTVLNFSTDAGATAYKLAACGIPTATGTSASGTTAFGNDQLYKWMVNGLVPIAGGHWYHSGYAGVFLLSLFHYSSNSYSTVGGFASVTCGQ